MAEHVFRRTLVEDKYDPYRLFVVAEGVGSEDWNKNVVSVWSVAGVWLMPFRSAYCSFFKNGGPEFQVLTDAKLVLDSV